MRKRLVVVYLLLISLFFTSSMRIFTILSDPQTAAHTNSGYTVDVAQVRGTVYDCNGRPLTNRNRIWKTVCAPTVKGVSAVSQALSDSAAKPLLKQLQQGTPVCFESPCAIQDEGVVSFSVYDRYGSQPSAVHIIGYCGSDYTGVCGIEKAYDSVLAREQPLQVRFTCDARNRVLVGDSMKVLDDDYSVAAGVQLTIDGEIQQICEAAGAESISAGSIVVLEATTGKIRACASFPQYDPNDVSKSLQSDQSPFLNRALTAYNAGSVFKLCVAAAALEQGISPTASYCCQGSLTLVGHTFGCSVQGGHGQIELNGAIARSCNTYFVQLGQSVGGDGVWQMARRLGFGQSITLCTGINTDAGMLPAKTTLTQQPAALANFSFGQGELMATPLQIASMVQAIAADGNQYPPSLIEGLVDETGVPYDPPKPPLPTKVFSKETARQLQMAMIQTVESGTGLAAKPAQYGAGGKTATAETGWSKNGTAINQAWFAGFYPATSPRYVIVVLVENGISGGKTAAPIFRAIADGLTQTGKVK